MPALFGTLLLSAIAAADKPITFTLLHTNDLHAHVEPTMIRKVPFGGYARQATYIKQIRAKEKNVLLLNAGDTFQGTLYFNVYEGLADLAYLNAIRYDAMAVGNHEFDRGPSALATFAGYASFPIVSSNLDVSTDKDLNGKIKASTIRIVDGEKVGIVGCTTTELPDISSPGPTVKMKDLIPTVQGEVDALTRQGVNKIIVLSHLGFNEDQDLAKQLKDVDLIVGGHSHTPLGTPKIDGWPDSRGTYPTYVKDAAGSSTPIVQAWEWGKVIGHLKLSFDGKGKLVKMLEAKPVVLDSSIPEDPEISGLVAAFRKSIDALQTQPVGQSVIPINRDSVNGESLMADIIADGMLEATKQQGAVVAFINQGGVRASFEEGTLTYGQAISVQPFGNTLTVLDVTGAELKAGIEQGVGTGGQLTPSIGSSYVIDRSQPQGSRVTDLEIAGEPVDLNKIYRIALLSFTANGGDSLYAFRDAKGKRTDTGIIDLDAFLAYIKGHSPLNPKLDGRVRNK